MALEQEFKYYVTNQDALVKQYAGKYIVIKESTVLGAYDDEITALAETIKTHPLGTFLVQKCEPGTENFTQAFHSRVSFR